MILARFFAITQWHHLSFMVISIALFGLTASGIFLHLTKRRYGSESPALHLERTVPIFVCLFSVSAIVSFLAVNRIPLDYFKLSTEPAHSLYLVVIFLLLSLPFFFSGMISAFAYSYIPEKSGKIYFASMLGSALGALLPMVLIPILGVRETLLAAALCPVAFILPLMLVGGPRSAGFWPAPLTLTGLTLLLFFFPGIGKIDPSPYKLLSQFKRYPDSRIVESRDTIRGRFDYLQSPYIRYAPGLSLRYGKPVKAQSSIIRDGDSQLVLYDRDLSFSRFCLSFVGYHLFPDADSALIIQKGGGLSLACALSSNVRLIELIEELPPIARAVREHYKEDRLKVITENPRAYLARKKRSYDILQIESWGSSLPGMESLFQEYLFTQEAFRACYDSLSADGLLIICRRVLMPPADSLRLLVTAKHTLTSLSVDRPEDHLILLRNWDSFALVLSKAAISAKRLERLRDFTRQLNFDLATCPDIQPGEANRFHVLDKPYFYEAARALLGSNEKEFIRDYPLDISVQSDDIPFPNRYLRWSKIGEIIKSSGGRLYTLVLTGEMIVVILFLTALLISFLLLFLPVILVSRKTPPLILYFLSLGVGFMFLEMGFINAFTLLLGDPVVSLSFVLASLLLFSGVGGMVSDRLQVKNLKWICLGLFAASMIVALASGPILRYALSLPYFIRLLVSLLMVLPVSFLLGFPFPTAIRSLLSEPAQRAYGWAANGSASVLASIASVQVAMSWGISRLFLAGALAYMLAFAMLMRLRSRV